VLLDGGIDLMREPRNSRNFEDFWEDPLVSGVLGGEYLKGAARKASCARSASRLAVR